MKLSLIVPCYNEQDNVKTFTKTVNDILKNFSYEIIFINDGSKDNTLIELKKLAQNKKINIKIIDFSRNFGKEAGIYAGLKMAKGEYINIIDADLQQNPKYVLEMMNILEENPEYDMVAAYQKVRKENAILSFFKKTFYKLINNMSETEFVNGASDFRLFKRKVGEAILEFKEYYRFSKGIFSWVGFNTYYMPYEVETRLNGKSKWSFWKLFKYGINGIVSFSTSPLRVSTILGFLVSLFSIIYFFIVIIQKIFFQIAIEGYATIVGLILLFGGIQLLCLGIIGEYLARTYVETKNRPVYITREIIDNQKGEKHDKD